MWSSHAVRRRADHGTRRDGAAPDPESARRTAERSCDGDDPGHPRPGRRRRPDRRDHGHVRRQGRREGARRTICSLTCATPTPRVCSGRSPRSRRRSTPAWSPFRAARRISSTRHRAASSLRGVPTRRTSAAQRSRRCVRSIRPTTSSPVTSRWARPRGRRHSRPTSRRSTRRRSPRSASSVRPRSCRSDGWIRNRTPASRRRGAPPGQRSRRRVPCRQETTRSRRSAGSASTWRVARRSDSSVNPGCGKSTTGKAILQLPKPTSGSVMLDGEDLVSLDSESMRTPPNATADDLPGPDLVAESSPHGGRGGRRAAQRVGTEEPRRAVEHRGADPRSGRYRSGAGEVQASTRVLRRAVPTHLDRARRW